jgi:hypothetical protein
MVRAHIIAVSLSRLPKMYLASAVLLFCHTAFSQSSVTVTLDSKNPGAVIPANFSGLSFETLAMLPDANGKHLFTPENLPLIRLFNTLGIKNLRIGGNTADRPSVGIPSRPDIDKLFAFAKAANVEVIYTLRMRESTPQAAASAAKYIADQYKSQIVCFAIGNEPDIYAKEYPNYRKLWTDFTDAILDIAPDAKFCGPSTTQGKAEWARNFANDFGHSGKVKLLAQHSYPGGSGRKVTNVDAGRARILSPEFAPSYDKFETSFAPEALANGIPYRVEETNNFYNGGAEGVSNSFASALWGLDYLHWWASHGAAGINFHTGDQVAAGEQQAPCWYALFWKAENGYAVHPLGYAAKAFDLGSHGRVVKATITSNPDHLNVVAYSTMGLDNKLIITLINKEHAVGAREIAISVDPGRAYSRARVIYLSAPKNDVAAESGITLGGKSISDAGAWVESWAPLKTRKSDEKYTITLSPASAAVLELTKPRP